MARPEPAGYVPDPVEDTIPITYDPAVLDFDVDGPVPDPWPDRPARPHPVSGLVIVGCLVVLGLLVALYGHQHGWW